MGVGTGVMASREETLGGVLDDLGRSGREDAVSVGDVLDAFAGRSLGILLALIGLVVVMPIIGDIPGAAILCATLALVAVGQSLVGGKGLWAPEFVRRQEVSRERLARGLELARPWVRRIDRLLKPRLTAVIAGRPQRWTAALAAAFLALALYPLAFVPFGANAPGAGLIALGLGLMARDGLLTLIGYALAGLTVYVLLTALWL